LYLADGIVADRGSITAFEIAEVACEQDAERKPLRPELRDLLMRLAGDRGNVSTRALARWLRSRRSPHASVDRPAAPSSVSPPNARVRF
jgi:hypothetical protein